MKQSRRTPTTAPQSAIRKRFYGNIELDPILAKKQFADFVDGIVEPFALKSGTKIRISIEIEAESGQGFDESLQRTVKENS